MSTATNGPAISSYAQAPTRTISAGGVTYAYRELGPERGTPIIFFVHLADEIEHAPAILARHACRVLQVKDRIARAAQAATLVKGVPGVD